MKLRNLSKRDYLHNLNGKTIRLNHGEEGVIPDEVAKLWIKSPEISVVDDGAKDKEIARLKKELAKAKEAEKTEEKPAEAKKSKKQALKDLIAE